MLTLASFQGLKYNFHPSIKNINKMLKNSEDQQGHNAIP